MELSVTCKCGSNNLSIPDDATDDSLVTWRSLSPRSFRKATLRPLRGRNLISSVRLAHTFCPVPSGSSR